MGPFMARVEDVAQKRLESDSKLHYMSPEVVHRELLQELDRYYQPSFLKPAVNMHTLVDILSLNVPSQSCRRFQTQPSQLAFNSQSKKS